MSNWFFWGISSAIGTAIWNLTLLNSPKAILDDTTAKSQYLRIIIIIAGIISFISLLLQKFNISPKILKNVKYWYVLWTAVCLVTYQMLLIYAFSNGGPLAIAIVNLNIIIMIIYGVLFNHQKSDVYLWIMLIIYAALGMIINHYNSTILK